jgi:predicted transcriptional regulator
MNNNFINTDWRRSKVMELSSQGYNQSEIAKILQISQPTISRDIHYIKQLARSNITKYIDHELPFEYDKCLIALNSLQKKAWEISENPETEERTKVQALSLAKECVINKLDLLTNATVVEDSIKFVQCGKEKLIYSKEENGKESKEEPAHDQELERKQEKEESEEFATTTTTTTVNQVF